MAVPLHGNPQLQKGDLLTVGGPDPALLNDIRKLGPEVADEQARHLDIDQAEIVVTDRQFVGKTLDELQASRPAYGTRMRALFRGGHELAAAAGDAARPPRRAACARAGRRP